MILGFYGPSNSGKTETITRLVKHFSGKNYRIATIKHISGEFSIDSEGKDTWKMGNSGAELVIASSDNETTFIFKKGMDPRKILQMINSFDDFDLILIEGFKSVPWIKKVKFGEGESKENTVIDFNGDLGSLISYIERELEIEKIVKKLPNFNCGECGFKTCRDLAEKILNNERRLEDCRYYNPEAVMHIEVNGREIYLSPFVQNIVKNTITGMLSSLKGVGKVESLNIRMKF
ncbi:MAG: molybdopterin-guanine dinucleotide biosynthesis protein B [Thermoplasmata archaeon]